MSYVPSPGNITDAHRDLLAWIGPDADRDTAAVALSVHWEMKGMTRSIRTAILALFPEPKDPQPEPYRDFLPPVVPCAEGFHWIGQPMTSCDKCGLPVWEHEGMADLDRTMDHPSDDVPWKLRPWEPGERDAIRRKWDPTWPREGAS